MAPAAMLTFQMSKQHNLKCLVFDTNMDNKVCRACLKPCVYKSLFTEHRNISKTYSSMLKYCTSIEAELDDGLPSQICINCMTSLVAFYRFRQKVLESDKKLKECVTPKIEIKVEIDEKAVFAPVEIIKCENTEAYVVVKEEKIDEEPMKIAPQSPRKRAREKTVEHDDQPKKNPKFGDFITQKRPHKGAKLHQCTICKKHFNAIGIYLSHMLVHVRQRPYACAICGVAFTTSNFVNHHMRKHPGDPPFPFKCLLCTKRFVHTRYLNAHMKIHHGFQQNEALVIVK